jgi:hypothetical protein
MNLELEQRMEAVLATQPVCCLLPTPSNDNPSSRPARGRVFPKRLYKLRAHIEQTIGKLKRFKRVAMRCEKTDTSYAAIISFACRLMLVGSVHTAWLGQIAEPADRQ